MSYPLLSRSGGRAGSDVAVTELAPDPGEIHVVRRVRREVAERLTRAIRAHESATRTVESVEERRAHVDRTTVLRSDVTSSVYIA